MDQEAVNANISELKFSIPQYHFKDRRRQQEMTKFLNENMHKLADKSCRKCPGNGKAGINDAGETVVCSCVLKALRRKAEKARQELAAKGIPEEEVKVGTAPEVKVAIAPEVKVEESTKENNG